MTIKPAAHTSSPHQLPLAPPADDALWGTSGLGFAELLAALEKETEPATRRLKDSGGDDSEPARPAERHKQADHEPPPEVPPPEVPQPEILRAGDLFLPAALPPRAPASEAQVLLDPLSAQAAAQEMLRQVAIHQVGAQTTLQLELEATRLSRISLQLQLENGQLNARFLVADEAGLGILRAAAGDLERALQDKGLTLGVLEFAHRDAGTGGAGDQQQQQPFATAADQGSDCEASRRPGARRKATSRSSGGLVI